MEKTKTKPTGLHRHEKLRVVMTPLGSAASNVFNIINMTFFMTFCTEALNLNVAVVGIIMTAMRLFDGVTDPLIANLIDKTETRFGKFRPFLVAGSGIMIVSSLAIYMVSQYVPVSLRLVWVILWYSVWVLGYTCMTTVNKAVLAIVTNDPRKRPLAGIAGGIYNTVCGGIVTVAIVPLLQKMGGIGSLRGWAAVISGAVALHVLMLVGGLFAISSADKPEYYRMMPKAQKQKGIFRKSVDLIRVNKPLRMLIIAASTDKLAASIAAGSITYFYIYAVRNLDLMPLVNGIVLGVSVIGAFIAGFVAVKFGCKRASLFGSWANFIIELILIIFRPFGDKISFLFIALMVLNGLFRRFSAQNVNPLIAEIIDYHYLKTGEFTPAFIGAAFSFIDKIVSALGPTICGVLMGIVGYKGGAEPTPALYAMTIAIFLGGPLLGDLASMLSMRLFNITKEEYAQMYALKEKSAAAAAGQPVQPEQPEQPEQSEQPEQPEQTEQPEQPEQPAQAEEPKE